MSRDLFEFQKAPVQAGRDKNLLINDACGLGKTTTAVAILKYVRNEVNRPSLFICPKRAKEQARREMLAMGIGGDDIVVGGAEPITVPRISNWILILHYEAVVSHLKALAKVKWATIVVDEGHHIKNPQAQRSKAVKKLRAHRKLVLTGTPMERSPRELQSILEFLYPETYRGCRREFCAKYERFYIDPDGGYKVVMPGAKNATQLANEIAPFTFARKKEDVAPDLPPNIITHVTIPLDGEQLALYRRIERSTDLEVIGPELDNPLYIPTRLAQLIRLQQAAVDPRLIGSIAASAKLEWLRSYVDDNPDEKMLLLTNFRETAELLAEQHDAHLIIGGRAAPRDLGSKNRVVMTVASAEALDLGWISTAVFLDVNWRWALHEQAINRIHRINITAPKQTIYLLAQDTIDWDMLAAVENKWNEYELLRHYVYKRETAANQHKN